MATKSTIKVVSGTDPAETLAAHQAAEDLAALNDAEGGSLFRAIEEARSTQGAEVILTRTMPADQAGFCDKIPVAEFDLQLIKSRYGPGTYRVRFNGPTGFLPGGGTIKIAPLRERDAGGGNDLSTLLQIMEKRDEERRRESAEKNNRLIELGIPALATVLGAFLTRQSGSDIPALITALKPQPGPSLSDLTTTMLNMQKLSNPTADSADPVDRVLRVMEAVNNLQADKAESSGKGSSNWLDVVRDLIKEAGPAVKPVLEGLQRQAQLRAQAAQPVAVQQVTPGIPAPVPAVGQPNISPSAESIPAKTSAGTAAPTPTETNVDVYDQYKFFIQPHVNKVMAWIAEDKNPQAYADVFVDELPGQIAQYISQDQALIYLKNEKWFEFICTKEPFFKNHEKWLNEFRLELIDILSPTSDEATETPNPGTASNEE
jgi:hypothetical protein